MWQKIKTVFSIIGAVLSVALFTFLLFLLRRRSADGRGCTDSTDRDSGIQEGLAEASDTAGRCEERLQRAEDILRRAIERSRKENGTPEDSGDSD